MMIDGALMMFWIKMVEKWNKDGSSITSPVARGERMHLVSDEHGKGINYTGKHKIDDGNTVDSGCVPCCTRCTSLLN
jgi:hypothetical protein